MQQRSGPVIWTIGHSTRTFDEFIELLMAQDIDLILDVRRFPGSRRCPHFAQPQFEEALSRRGLKYLHLPELGGRRRPASHSRNTIWKNPSFRAYADYMATPAFDLGIGHLLAAAENHRPALMCAEALWWRCHRALISDYLKARGLTVLHIMGPGKIQEHPFTSAARVLGSRVSYEPRSKAA